MGPTCQVQLPLSSAFLLAPLRREARRRPRGPCSTAGPRCSAPAPPCAHTRPRPRRRAHSMATARTTDRGSRRGPRRPWPPGLGAALAHRAEGAGLAAHSWIRCGWLPLPRRAGVRPALASGRGSRGGAAPRWRKLGSPPVPSPAAAAVRCSSAQVPPPRGTSRREIESHPPAGDRGDGERGRKKKG